MIISYLYITRLPKDSRRILLFISHRTTRQSISLTSDLSCSQPCSYRRQFETVGSINNPLQPPHLPP